MPDRPTSPGVLWRCVEVRADAGYDYGSRHEVMLTDRARAREWMEVNATKRGQAAREEYPLPTGLTRYRIEPVLLNGASMPTVEIPCQCCRGTGRSVGPMWLPEEL